MAFLAPDNRFDDAHLARDTAPDGSIDVIIACDGSECAGPMRVQVLEVANGAVLAEGPVKCTMKEELHALPMKALRPLGTTTARVRFSCGTEEADGAQRMIWLQRTA